MYYKSTKFNENRYSYFWEIRNLIFFLMWSTLNFRVRGKTKKTARDIYMRTLYIDFERDRSIGLGSTFGDDHTDRQHTHTHTHTHTQTFFLKHIFRLWEWCRMENHKKKSKSKILTIAILPSLLMSLESKNILIIKHGNLKIKKNPVP